MGGRRDACRPGSWAGDELSLRREPRPSFSLCTTGHLASKRGALKEPCSAERHAASPRAWPHPISFRESHAMLRVAQSTVLWLSEQGRDFTGGELAFLHNRTWAWLVVEPRVGRAAVFSSGWENVHGIKPLTRGVGAATGACHAAFRHTHHHAVVSISAGDRICSAPRLPQVRWALSVPLTVHDELREVRAPRASSAPAASPAGAIEGDGTRFRRLCVSPTTKIEYQGCREQWTTLF